jgi:hypothetical protein
MSKFFCAQRGCVFELADKPAELEADGVTVKAAAAPADAPELCPTCGNPFVPHPLTDRRRALRDPRRRALLEAQRARRSAEGAAELGELEELEELEAAGVLEGAAVLEGLEELEGTAELALEQRVADAFAAATPAARVAALEAALASLASPPAA